MYTVRPTLTVLADSQIIQYGDTPSASFKIEGLLRGDSASEAYTGSPAIVLPTQTDVGEWEIGVQQGSFLSPQGYQFRFVPGKLKITPAPLTVTAANVTRFYGEPNYFTATYTGFKFGENESVLGGSLSFATRGTVSAGVGQYLVTHQGLTSNNYTISYRDGTLTINKRPIAVTGNLGQRKFYGDSDPVFTYTVGGRGLVNGDKLNGNLIREPGENAGTYALKLGTLNNDNYNITSFIGADFNITKRPLTITADSTSRLYGDANPLVTGFTLAKDGEETSRGLAFDDTVISVTNTITPSAAVFGQGTAANYDITYQNGTLRILKSPLIVKANNASSFYGTSNPPFS